MTTLAPVLTAALALVAIGCTVVLLLVRTRRDPVTLISTHLALLFLFPAVMVIGPLGAVGSPALLVGVAAAMVWMIAKAAPNSGLDRGWQPIRLALLLYTAVMLASYANGQLRPLTDLEQTGSSRGLIFLVSLLGVALLIADGVHTRERLDILLRRLLLGAGFLAAVGVVQFLVGFDPTPYLQLPGLELNRDLVGITDRSIFNRPWGTAQHAIEFGVVLGVLVPMALHYALTAPHGRQQILQWGLALLIAVAVPMSVSRSGIVAAMVSMTVFSFAWSWRGRLNLAVWGLVFVSAMWALIPGLTGTLHSMFMGHGSDPSIIARRERVPIVWDYIAQHPWLGHGFGTFTVDEYLLVDNEIYVTAIATGLVGLAAFLGLIVVGGFTAIHVRRLTPDPATRQLGQAIAAGLAGLMVCLYTFDAFHYRMFMGTMFVLLGAAGALWRLTRQETDRLAASPSAVPETSSQAASLHRIGPRG